MPSARRLVRRGWRLAQGLRGDLLIGYLKRDFSDDEQVELARTIELAEDLNARILPLQTDDELKGLQGVIEAEDVNHLVLAHSPRKGLSGLLARSLADRVLSTLLHVDVHLVAIRPG